MLRAFPGGTLFMATLLMPGILVVPCPLLLMPRILSMPSVLGILLMPSMRLVQHLGIFPIMPLTRHPDEKRRSSKAGQEHRSHAALS